jgi:hypothetical protein
MHTKLAAYITTGPVTHPEAAWAKSIGLPHLSYGGAQALAVVLVVAFVLVVVLGGFKALVK